MSEEEENITMPDWKTQLRKAIDNINNIKPKDRLDICYGLFYMFFMVNKSTSGWLGWLQNPSVLKEFDEAQLKEYYALAHKCTIELLELDYTATDRYHELMKKVTQNGETPTRQSQYG